MSEIPGIDIAADMAGVHLRFENGTQPKHLRFLEPEQALQLADMLRAAVAKAHAERVAYARRHPGQLSDEAELTRSAK